MYNDKQTNEKDEMNVWQGGWNLFKTTNLIMKWSNFVAFDNLPFMILLYKQIVKKEKK